MKETMKSLLTETQKEQIKVTILIGLRAGAVAIAKEILRQTGEK